MSSYQVKVTLSSSPITMRVSDGSVVTSSEMICDAVEEDGVVKIYPVKQRPTPDVKSEGPSTLDM